MPTPTHRRCAFTLVELLVVVAIIGVLVAMLLPAAQAARESARRSQCVTHLQNVARATLLLHDAVLAFPPARLRTRDYTEENTGCETTQPSWLARLLPYVEEQAAAARWDANATFESHSDRTRQYAPSIYVCPSRRSISDALVKTGEYEQEFVYGCGCSSTEVVTLIGGAAGDYAGNHGDFTGGANTPEYAYWLGGNGTGVIISSRPLCREGQVAGWIDKVRMKDLIDGASKTALAGEMHVPFDRLAHPPENGPMYNGRDLPAFARIGGVGVGIARGPADRTVPAIGFGSWHPGVCPMAMTDGSVRLVDNGIDSQTLQSMCRRNDEYDPEIPQFMF